MLKETFLTLLSTYTDDAQQKNSLWEEIEKAYTGRNRYYHNLQHLDDLLKLLNEVRPEIKQWDALLFSLYYHDFIYHPQRGDNEEKSAQCAAKRMMELAVPSLCIQQCEAQILATKSHQPSASMDTNYFTDADLSILGRDWETYWQYAQNVRKEYAIYPDLLYKPGRRKVLRHFLSMKRIFKTDHFHDALEQQAKQNLQKELMLLE